MTGPITMLDREVNHSQNEDHPSDGISQMQSKPLSYTRSQISSKKVRPHESVPSNMADKLAHLERKIKLLEQTLEQSHSSEKTNILEQNMEATRKNLSRIAERYNLNAPDPKDRGLFFTDEERRRKMGLTPDGKGLLPH
jgi:hypothetical protein